MFPDFKFQGTRCADIVMRIRLVMIDKIMPVIEACWIFAIQYKDANAFIQNVIH